MMILDLRWLGAAAALLTLTLSGCATLSEEECRVADWRAIGYEDGASGHDAARLKKHREACAEYGIQISFTEYHNGRDLGLREEYCTPRRGYEVGIGGLSYGGVCPQELEEGFLDGYVYGREVYTAQSAVNTKRRAIESMHTHVHNIEAEILQKEEALIADGLTRTQREQIQNEIKELEAEMVELERDMVAAEAELGDWQYRLDGLRARSPY